MRVAIERIGTRCALVEQTPTIAARIIFNAQSVVRTAFLDRRDMWRWEEDGALVDALTAQALEQE